MSIGAADLALAAGLMLVAEGLVLALAAGRIDEMLALLRTLPVEGRRAIGLAAVAAGVALIWAVARSAG